jgi:hypothetical protein
MRLPKGRLAIPSSFGFVVLGAAALACSGSSSSSSHGDASTTDASPVDAFSSDAPPSDGRIVDALVDAPVSDGSVADAPITDAAFDGGPCMLQVPDGDVCETVCLVEPNSPDAGFYPVACQTYCSPETGECYLEGGMENYNCDFSASSDGGGEVFC